MISEALIDSTVKKIFEDIRFKGEPEGLYAPLAYMIEVGGKRIRPRLCLTSYALFSDELSEDVLNPAAALEVFHTFTLIHDDIMDKSPLRRGMPTVWKKWNEDTAILSGDVMLIDSYQRMMKVPSRCLDKALELFSTTAAQVCEGQQLDMDYEDRPEVSMEEYEKMIGLKTAVLLACSAKMGAILGGASEIQAQAVYNYGYELGMAFQIADDYLDTFGDVKVFGKPIGGDIVNGKKTWLLTRALEKTDDKDKLLSIMSRNSVSDEEKLIKIKLVKDIYRSLGVDEDAKSAILEYSDKALDAVHSLHLSPLRLELLHRFSEKLVGRAN